MSYSTVRDVPFSMGPDETVYSYWKGISTEDTPHIDSPEEILNTSAESVEVSHAETPTTDMKWGFSEYKNLKDPRVWGPAFWFTLHNGADNYSEKANKIAISKMVGFVNGIPYMLPCKTCAMHADGFIDNARNSPGGLDAVCSGRKSLRKFFIDFHNQVNERYGKPVKTYKEVDAMYSGKIKVASMTFY
jgi:hypothetical protein